MKKTRKTKTPLLRALMGELSSISSDFAQPAKKRAPTKARKTKAHKPVKARKVAKAEQPHFRLGATVKYVVANRFGVARGKGKVKELPPANPGPGENRVTVLLADGSQIRPYVTQCKAA